MSCKESIQSLEERLERLEEERKEKNKKVETLRQKLGADNLKTFEDGGFTYEKHRQFVLTLDDDKDTFFYCATEHLRIQGVFWGLGTMDMLGCRYEMNMDEIVTWTLKCYHPKVGGFGGNIGHDPHILYTQHAIYVLALCNALDQLETDAVVSYIASLQQPDGSFKGDEWGEIDTRFSYCAIAGLAVLKRLDAIDLDAALGFLVNCQNFDGGFGSVPGAESHAGYIFTAVAALSIGGGLNRISNEEWDKLAWWLCERQCDSGGLNGRPEKQADVCYSWWVLSTLHILRRLDWIDKEKLLGFILKCQDPKGGIGDRPQNVGDIYHTFFGIAGACLLGYFGNSDRDGRKDEKGVLYPIRLIDPVFALPQHLLQKLGVGASKVDRK